MDTQGYEGYVLAGARRWLDAGTLLAAEFWPYAMKRANSFGLMKAALANYSGFHDLWQNPNRYRPISDLDDLYAELDKAGDFGEIGADQLRPPGHASGSRTFWQLARLMRDFFDKLALQGIGFHCSGQPSLGRMDAPFGEATWGN